MEKLKIKNEFFDIINNNSDVVEDILNKELPTRLSYWISKNMDRIRSESKIYFDAKTKLVDKYKKEDSDEDLPEGQVQLENVEEFMKELTELQDIENDIDITFVDLDFEELDEKNVRFRPIEMSVMPFLRVKEDG